MKLNKKEVDIMDSIVNSIYNLSIKIEEIRPRGGFKEYAEKKICLHNEITIECYCCEKSRTYIFHGKIVLVNSTTYCTSCGEKLICMIEGVIYKRKDKFTWVALEI